MAAQCWGSRNWAGSAIVKDKSGSWTEGWKDAIMVYCSAMIYLVMPQQKQLVCLGNTVPICAVSRMCLMRPC